MISQDNPIFKRACQTRYLQFIAANLELALMRTQNPNSQYIYTIHPDLYREFFNIYSRNCTVFNWGFIIFETFLVKNIMYNFCRVNKSNGIIVILIRNKKLEIIKIITYYKFTCVISWIQI